MPNIKSQKKRMRKSEEQRQRNKAIKTSLKTHVKKFDQVCESGDGEGSKEAYETAARALDKAVSKGVIHKNNAANNKSRMAKTLNALK